MKEKKERNHSNKPGSWGAIEIGLTVQEVMGPTNHKPFSDEWFDQLNRESSKKFPREVVMIPRSQYEAMMRALKEKE